MDKQRGGFRDCPEKPMLQNKRADKMVSRNFPEELAVGIEVELEHTKDRGIARRIALDHLIEDPGYYDKLNDAGLVDEPKAKQMLEKALVIRIPKVLLKARDRSHLVPKVITATNKHGKSYQTTVHVKAGEDEKKIRQKAAPEDMKTKRTKTEEEPKELKVGDPISYMAEGKIRTGMVAKTGFDDGIIARSEGGKEYPVEWENLKPSAKQTSGNNNKMFSDKDEIRALFKKSIKHYGWRNGESGVQPFNTVDSMYEMAGAARGDFLEKSNAVKAKFAEISPVLITRSELKKLERIKEKILEDDNGEGVLYNKETDTYNTKLIRDVDGHTFSVKSIDEVEKLLKHYDLDADVVRIKNNFAKPTPVGYSDININVKLPNGTISEIQINTHANIVAKEKYGHSLYEVWRSISNNPEHKELADLAAETQKTLYGMSNKYSKEGSFPDIGEKNPFFQVEHEPYADAIRDNVSKAKPLFYKAKKDGVLDKNTIKHFEELITLLGA